MYPEQRTTNESKTSSENEKKNEVDIETEDYDSSFADLFVCEDYIERSWRFGENTPSCDSEQRLLCSNQSSTDHDLTGQIVWPASLLLCWFISKHREEFFRDKRVIELGAGCGLAGFFASKFSKQVLITDGNPVVLR